MNISIILFIILAASLEVITIQPPVHLTFTVLNFCWINFQEQQIVSLN